MPGSNIAESFLLGGTGHRSRTGHRGSSVLMVEVQPSVMGPRCKTIRFDLAASSSHSPSIALTSPSDATVR